MNGKLGHFELLEQIGQGGIASVFKAYDPSLNRHVAIKVMRRELAEEDPEFVENFLREARNAAAINHPNIVQIYFIGEEEGVYYLVMELLEGETLDDILEHKGPLDEETVLRIGTEVTEALGAAYANQLVHGDIKPQNIFITNRGHAKLLDFGLAKLAKFDVMNFELVKQGKIAEVQKGDGMIWGSPYYMSPERVGQKAEDLRSDIYSLGATMYHALVGRPPFEAETNDDLMAMLLHEPAPRLRQTNPEISEQTEEVVAKMLEKTPFVRQVNYDQLLEELQKAARFLSRKSVRIEAPSLASPPAAEPEPEPKKSRLPLIISAVAAMVVIGGGYAFLTSRKEVAPA